MKLQEIIESLSDEYSAEKEKNLVNQFNAMTLASISPKIADLLALCISEQYNDLAKAILAKDYHGTKLDPQMINQALINQNSKQYSLLHFTAQFGNKVMILYFLNNGVKISNDSDLSSPVHAITFAKNLKKADFKEIITKFEELSPGIINQHDIYKLSPLHYAAHNDNIQALEALIELGAKR